jgi:hypothetical protein
MERKLTIKEKAGVFAAIVMFLSIGMIMGGGSAGNTNLVYTGGAFFGLGGIIGVWLILDSKKNEKDEDDELFM